MFEVCSLDFLVIATTADGIAWAVCLTPFTFIAFTLVVLRVVHSVKHVVPLDLCDTNLPVGI